MLPKHLSNIRAIRQLWLGFQALGYLIHYTGVIMTTVASQITSRTVVHSTVYSDADKENIKAPRHWPVCGEFTGTGEFPAQRASYAENVSIWWRHHGSLSNPLIASRCDLDSILKCWVCHIMAITLHVVGIPYGDISDNISYYGQVLFPNRNHTGLPSCKRYSKCWHDY